MSTFQHSELLPEHEILQNKIPTGYGRGGSGLRSRGAGLNMVMELYQINDWKFCCKLLILQPARVLAGHNGFLKC
jgi:hypothetical protein